MKKIVFALIVLLIGMNIANLNTVISVAPQKNSKLLPSQSMNNLFANDLTYHTNIEPAVPAEPPEMEFETLDNVLDPGSGANGWSLSNPPPIWGITQYAYSPMDNKDFNLFLDEDRHELSNYMFEHYGFLIIFTFEGDFLFEIAESQYKVERHIVTFYASLVDPYFPLNGGIDYFLHVSNIYVNDEKLDDPKNKVKASTLIDILALAYDITKAEALQEFARSLTPIAGYLLTLTVTFFAAAFKASGTTAMFAALAGAISSLFCVALVVAIIVISIYVCIVKIKAG